MNYQLAQINIAKFRLPAEHSVNNDFMNSLDKVNASAEAASGFVWRFLGSENNELELQTFKDPNIIVNMSVWSDIESLVTFVYRNDDHKSIMRRRKEWFDKIEFHMVLWWIEENQFPTVEDAKTRMDMLRDQGPIPSAFTFKTAFSAHNGEPLDSFTDKCA